MVVHSAAQNTDINRRSIDSNINRAHHNIDIIEMHP